MSFINYIKTAKGYTFERVDGAFMFYCRDLNVYAFFKSYSDYMINADGSQDEMIYAGKVVDAY